MMFAILPGHFLQKMELVEELSQAAWLPALLGLGCLCQDRVGIGNALLPAPVLKKASRESCTCSLSWLPILQVHIFQYFL